MAQEFETANIPMQRRGDFAVIAPHFCLTSASVYINYLTQGMLPWSSPQPPAALDRALANLRDARNRQLEDDVADVLRTAGYTCETRIRERNAKRLGVPLLSGEIDIVAGRAGSRIIWLLEVKDPADVYVVPEIRRHLDRFYVTHGKDKAYAELLGAKLKELTPHANAVANALRLPVTQDLAYEIRPIFVTRRPVPAAFAEGLFPFTTLRELTQTLSAAEQHALHIEWKSADADAFRDCPSSKRGGRETCWLRSALDELLTTNWRLPWARRRVPAVISDIPGPVPGECGCHEWHDG